MNSRIPVHCSYSKDVYNAGEVVTALIRAPLCPEAVIFAQAVGILQLDERWIKVPTKYSDGNDIISGAAALSQNFTNKSYTSISIFATTHEAIAYSHVSDEGAYLQFELPRDTLPSFTGIAGSILYVIMLSLQLPHETLRCQFPFRVHGCGSSALTYKR